MEDRLALPISADFASMVRVTLNGQSDPELGSFAHHAGDVDVAAVCFHHAPGERESRSSAMLGRQISAGELVRKERALRQSNQCETSCLSHNLGECWPGRSCTFLF